MNKRNLINILVIFAIAIGLAAISAVIYHVYRAPAIVDQVRKQLYALRTNHFEQAYSYTSADFQRATSRDNFQRFIEQYPAMKNNVDATFSEREESGDNASLKAVVRGKDDAEITVEYHLIKEHDQWKIIAIQVIPNPTPDSAESALEQQENAAVEAKAMLLTKTYENKDSHYSIKYPTSWEYDSSSLGTIIFSGRQGSPAYFATINVQTVLTKKTGGQFASVREFITDIRKQAKKESKKVIFLEDGPFIIEQQDGAKIEGEFLIFTYDYRGESFKQWQIVLKRPDGQVFYAWAYTSPVEIYDRYMVVAKAMLESWRIY